MLRLQNDQKVHPYSPKYHAPQWLADLTLRPKSEQNFEAVFLPFVSHSRQLLFPIQIYDQEAFGRTMKRKALKKLPRRRRSFDDHPDRTKGSAMQNCHQNNYQAAEAGAPLVQKDLASLKMSTEIPPSSFEFYVWSDEGINLHVNLNSSPSDWTNRFRKEVCITENLHQNESWSFWQEIGCLGESSTERKSSFIQNMKPNQIETRRRQTKSQPNLRLTNDVTGSDQQDIGDNSLISDALKPFSISGNVEDKLKDNETIVTAALTGNMVGDSKEGQSTVSAELGYGARNNFISGAESCAKDASKDAGTAFIKSMCGSFGNSLSDPDKMECQNSKPVSSSAELQNSEVASCHKHASASLCENDGTLDLMNPNMSSTRPDELVNSSKFNLDTNGNDFLLNEEWEFDKTVNGRESSECSQFDDPLKSGLVSDDQDSKVELQRKRKRKDSNVQDYSAEPFTRILRSMKAPRRSIRLFSKWKGP
ncbi:uncharacterized protein LOC114736406 isoform X2 [Neltuma alba]|uniref:uncharacterized protein LOC114736406 isoform X2 n=1 Tax=Neltuma alba TaxID=207710 RepID=UPI0010A53CC9|nr:uncharacterized protein LOC114736406 isoform X2 [Prosopis alba]